MCFWYVDIFRELTYWYYTHITSDKLYIISVQMQDRPLLLSIWLMGHHRLRVSMLWEQPRQRCITVLQHRLLILATVQWWRMSQLLLATSRMCCRTIWKFVQAEFVVINLALTALTVNLIQPVDMVPTSALSVTLSRRLYVWYVDL